MSKNVGYSKNDKYSNLEVLLRNVGSSRAKFYRVMTDGYHTREALLKHNPNTKLTQTFWTVGKK